MIKVKTLTTTEGWLIGKVRDGVLAIRAESGCTRRRDGRVGEYEIEVEERGLFIFPMIDGKRIGKIGIFDFGEVDASVYFGTEAAKTSVCRHTEVDEETGYTAEVVTVYIWGEDGKILAHVVIGEDRLIHFHDEWGVGFAVITYEVEEDE